MGDHVYVERADPDTKGYEEGTRRHFNVVDRYAWANQYVRGLTLDIPCGMGWGTSLITNADIIIGIDNCREALQKARKLYPNIIFALDNMLDLLLPNGCFDTIICCEGYEHVKREDQFTLVNELYRIVKPIGIVLMTIPIAKYPGYWSGNKFHLHEPTMEEVEETFKDKFRIVDMIKPNVARFVLEPIK